MEHVPDTRYVSKITGRIVGCHRNQWYNAGTKKDPPGDSGKVFIGTRGFMPFVLQAYCITVSLDRTPQCQEFSIHHNSILTAGRWAFRAMRSFCLHDRSSAMSIRLMSQVWEKQLTPGQQRVLLVLCDHANDQGTNCYPSIEYVAWKIGITPKTVMAMVAELEELGAIQVRREHRKRNLYRIRLHNLPDKPPFKKLESDDEDWPDDDFVGSQNVTQENLGSQNVTQKDENVTQRVTKCDPKVEKMLPQPLVNHQSNHEIETLDANPASSDADLSGIEGLQSSLKKTKNEKSTDATARAAKDDRRVWGMVDSYFDARGLEGHKMPNSQRHAAYNVFKELGAEYGATAVYGCASYLASQQWYQEPGRLTAKAVSNAIYEWDKKGRPTAEAPRAGQKTAFGFANTFQSIASSMKEHGL